MNIKDNKTIKTIKYVFNATSFPTGMSSLVGNVRWVGQSPYIPSVFLPACSLFLQSRPSKSFWGLCILWVESVSEVPAELVED